MPRTVAGPSAGVIQMAAATKGLNPIRRRIDAEGEWLSLLPVSEMCTIAGGKKTCEQHSPMPSFEARTRACSLYGVWEQALGMYADAISKVVDAAQWQTQRKLDRARADARSAAARLTRLAAAVKLAPDPCAIAELP